MTWHPAATLTLATSVCFAVAAPTTAQVTDGSRDAPATDRPTSWPTRAWPESSPEAEGLDPAVLAAIDEELRGGRYGYVDSMLIIRNGRVVFDKQYERDYADANVGRDQTPHQYNYFHPGWHPFYMGTRLHTMQSVTKSVTSLLIGIAIHEGAIPNARVAVLPYFADRNVADPDGRKGRMTLEHVLTMRAGLAWDEWSYGNGKRPKLFAALGFGGQQLLVVPELDLIGVFTGWNIYGRRPSTTTLFRDRIVGEAAGRAVSTDRD